MGYDGKLPNTPMEKGAKSKLDKAMRFLRENDVTAEMYNKNIPSTYRKGTMRSIMSGLSLQWANVQIPAHLTMHSAMN